MIKSGNYIIIPIGVSCFVIEEKEDKLELVGEAPGKSIDDIFNDMRKTVHGLAMQERKLVEQTERSWRRFQATKEFMSEAELKVTEGLWENFKLDEMKADCERFASNFEKALFELTDLMLEHNLVIKSVEGGEESPLKGISMESVKSMLDNLGKSE
jgi:hypothetical protein